jgi:uncharacterized membrane protein
MNGPPDSMTGLETLLGRLLAAGVLVSACILAVGLALFLLQGESRAEDQVIVAGLLCLMATPLLRVVVSIVEYVRMGRWFFVATTLAVLLELAVTVIYALRV